jgi:hypothetical protein
VHLGQALAQAAYRRSLLRDVAGAGGDGVGVAHGLAQLLLAGAAQGEVCVVARKHAPIIERRGVPVIGRVDEMQVIRANDRLGSEL